MDLSIIFYHLIPFVKKQCLYLAYFKGTWKDKPFEASKTKAKEFFLLDGSTVRAPFITCSKKQQIGVFDGFKVLRFQYEHGDDERLFSMYFYLPDEKDGLPGLVERFGSEPGFIEDHYPYATVKVGEFCFPKFRICFGFDALEVFKRLGLESMFNSNLTETVKPADNDQGLYLEKIIHKSFIEVNEEGTKAAAVSMAVMGIGSCGPCREVEKVDFVADHPFLFVIKEDLTRTVLFVGQVLNPLAED